ncbi:MAG: hypothetical protein GZ091_14780 [Paludibacter sp.]|nr:hypothetical protein [Paludibacter sp.]
MVTTNRFCSYWYWRIGIVASVKKTIII